MTGKETIDPVDVSSISLSTKKTKKNPWQLRRKPYQKSRPKDKDIAKDVCRFTIL